MPIRRIDKTLTATTATIAGEDIAASSIPVKPHIQYGVLQPAVAGKLLNGATHSGAYGTAQTQSGGDGHKYYYTDIKGSTPIKDPRIGSHFGSQRYITSSMQLLEQETATNGTNVYAIDGREWFRASTSTSGIYSINSSRGQGLGFSDKATDSSFIEIVGYFNDANISMNTDTSHDVLRVTLNGGTLQSTDFAAAMETPLIGRYVRSGSSINLTFNSTPTLGINTVKISNTTGKEVIFYNVELIAQDTSSTANKSKIQIPSQNVVSYGKKFAIPATAQHYDPFNGFTNGSSVTAYVDTATSLGVEGWKNSSTYYRPYNGGRVVKWIASDGTIKTSVNMMPPNARSIGNSSSLTNATAKANASIANNTFYPTMEAGAIDHSLAEVAKTFHWREFGNGSANSAGGGGTSNTYADASTLNSADSIGYVMDDGLTSLTGENVSDNNANYLIPDGDGDTVYYTFIGTGVSFKSDVSSIGIKNIAQNLPYGTHILKYLRGGTHKIYIDGVEVDSGNLYAISEITLHQPKMPPIPEDAVIIADYMLMADFVKQTDAEPTEISKGVRYCSGSRDHFYGGANAGGTNVSVYSFGITGGSSPSGSNGTGIWKLPFFGTTGLSMMENSNVAHTVKLNDSATNQTALDNSVSTAKDMISIAETVTLGQTSIESTLIQGSYHFMGHIVASPIHTSSHYQTFETPFLNELVGGDRNMEQNNLIVTPDGKSWDEVTRDTSYIGNCVVNTATDSETSWSTSAKFDEWRGMSFTYYPLMNKDFAIAYDRIICLVDGEYTIIATTRATGAGQNAAISINGTDIINANLPTDNQQFELSTSLPLKRGDYVMFKGSFGTSLGYNRFIITRL